MILNHLNLTVTDVPEPHEFFKTYFGLSVMGGNKNIALLTGKKGIMLSLTSMKVGRESEAAPKSAAINPL